MLLRHSSRREEWQTKANLQNLCGVSLFFTCRLRANWNQEGNLRRTVGFRAKLPYLLFLRNKSMGQVRRAPELKRGAGNSRL